MCLSKKKKIIIAVSILLVALVSFIGGSALGKYQSQVKGQGIADVAAWAFKVNGEETVIQNISLAESYNESTLTGGKIAPGTSGEFNIIVDGSGSEVGIEYNVTFTNETSKPTNLKFIYDGQEFNSIKDIEQLLSGSINANDENKSKLINIKWIWEYQTGDNEAEIATNDIIDTNEGKQDLNYTFDVVVTGTQIMPQ